MSQISPVNSRYIKYFVALLLGSVCVYYMAGSFDWKQIGQSLRKADSALFLLSSIGTILGFFLFRTLRWHALLKSENLTVPFYKLYLYNAISIGISNVTPFQSGEALKVELMRKYGVGRAAGYTIFLLEKLMDFALVIAMGMAGVRLGFDSGIAPVYFYVLAAVFIVGFCAVLIIGFRLPFERLNPIKDLLRERWRHKRALATAIFFTVCSWSAAVVGWKLTLASVGVEINILQSISLVSLSVLLALISFVPGAVGVSELGITAILTRAGIEPLAAQTGAIALRGYAVILLVLAVLHWIALKLLPKTTTKI